MRPTPFDDEVPVGPEINAGRVQELAAGRMLVPDSTSDAIAEAATDILLDGRFTDLSLIHI